MIKDIDFPLRIMMWLGLAFFIFFSWDLLNFLHLRVYNIHQIWKLILEEFSCTFIDVKVLVIQLCPTFCGPMNGSPPGYSLHGILQARMLEWVAIPFSRGSFWPRAWTWAFCTAGRFVKNLSRQGISLQFSAFFFFF